MWIFGYGSIIWRPDFAFEERRWARVEGWVRRFWQGSTDHRGVPEAPGRVVTLVPEPDGHVWGAAFRPRPSEAAQIIADLDVREQGGYAQHTVRAATDRGTIDAMVYLATPDNPNWLGPAPVEAMVAQIRASRGPSGDNLDYLLQLDDSLRAAGIEDEHVARLARLSRG